MERKLNITVIVSRPMGGDEVDVAWDEPAQPVLGQRPVQAQAEDTGTRRADAGVPRDDSAAD